MKYHWYEQLNFFSGAECKELESLAISNKSKLYIDVPANGKNLNSLVFSTDEPIIKEKLKNLFVFVNEINQLHFGFDIYTPFVNRGNLNFYQSGSDYNFHNDGTPLGSSSDSKLTVIVNISDSNYSGGEFKLFLGDEVVVDSINKSGNVLIFPSFIYHKVTPITFGIRKTLSFWLTGPSLK